MVDVARLGLAVDSSAVEKGTIELRQLTGAAGQASAAARQLAGASQAEAAGQRVATAATVAHTAAIQANNAAMRMNNQVRTNMIYQLNDVGVSLASGMNPVMVAIQQLPQMLQFGLKPAVRTLTDLISGLVTKFWPLVAVMGVATLYLQGLTNEINAVDGANVSLMDTAMAVFQTIADGVQAVLGPAFSWLGKQITFAVNEFFAEADREINFIIGAFVGAVEAIKAVWGQIPDALGYVMFEAARNVTNTVVQMVSGVMASINDLFSRLDHAAVSLGGSAFLPRLDVGSYQRDNYKLDANPYSSASGAVDAASAAFSDAMAQDYTGGWMGEVGRRAQDIARARKETEALGGAASAANDNVKKLADDGLKSAADRAQDLANNLGKSIGGALKDLISGTKDFGQVMLDVLGSVAQFALQQSASIFGGMGGGFGFFGNILSGLFGGGFANGGVFSGGHVQPFARGGVVSGPTLFPMANGMGLMGEAGPEAIMPLRRGADGRLGVAAANQNATNVHVTVGVKVDREGNIRPYVESVAKSAVGAAAPALIGASVSQANKTAPSAMSKYQTDTEGGDYRVA